jgi:hypothetical protein
MAKLDVASYPIKDFLCLSKNFPSFMIHLHVGAFIACHGAQLSHPFVIDF